MLRHRLGKSELNQMTVEVEVMGLSFVLWLDNLFLELKYP
jgi:hypothetical protein